MTFDNKYSLCKRGNLLQHLQMQLSQKQKIFFFLHFPNWDSISNIFKKSWPWQLMYFWTYGFRKSWLYKCLKSSVSEDPLRSDMVSGPKHCWNLKDSTFTIFADRCERNSGVKCLPKLYANSSYCLLTHWVPIISIVLLTEAIYCNILRCNYLNFLFNFLNLDSILNIKKKRWTS